MNLGCGDTIQSVTLFNPVVVVWSWVYYSTYLPTWGSSADISISIEKLFARPWLLPFPCSCFSNIWFWEIPSVLPSGLLLAAFSCPSLSIVRTIPIINSAGRACAGSSRFLNNLCLHHLHSGLGTILPIVAFLFSSFYCPLSSLFHCISSHFLSTSSLTPLSINPGNLTSGFPFFELLFMTSNCQIQWHFLSPHYPQYLSFMWRHRLPLLSGHAVPTIPKYTEISGSALISLSTPFYLCKSTFHSSFPCPTQTGLQKRIQINGQKNEGNYSPLV